MTLGTIIAFIVFGFIVLNIESYIKFMNMDVSIYKEFAIYSVIQLYIQLIFSYVLEKLYFERIGGSLNQRHHHFHAGVYL